MFVRRVHAPVGEKPHQVKGRPGRLHVAEERAHFGVRGERLGRIRLGTARAVDLHEVLKDHAARADIEVSDFGIPHLPFGKPNGEPVGTQFGMRPPVGKCRQKRRTNGGNHVGGGAVAPSPTVENHQKDLAAHRLTSLSQFNVRKPVVRGCGSYLQRASRNRAPGFEHSKHLKPGRSPMVRIIADRRG